MNAINLKDLCCCGNCEYYRDYECPLYVEVGVGTYASPKPLEVCDDWTYDGRTHKERMQNI
jgi:hypothetical protein